VRFLSATRPVMAFADHRDAQRVLDVLGKRLARYELTLHPDKTRFIDFRSDRSDGKDHPEADGSSFTFLGFCHVWGKSLKGKNVVRQVTAKQRYARALAAVTDWCRTNRHLSIPEQHTQLVAKMRGHYAYYGISGNGRRLRWYANQVERIWRTGLRQPKLTLPLAKRARDGRHNTADCRSRRRAWTHALTRVTQALGPKEALSVG
jgi:RNA-directed DNA polymerase